MTDKTPFHTPQSINCQGQKLFFTFLSTLFFKKERLDVAHHREKSVRIRKISDAYFSALGLNTEIYTVNFGIQSEYGKYRPEKLRIRTIFTPCRSLT